MSNIVIDLAKTDFRGGDTVKGAVVVNLRKRVKVRGVRLVCEGYEAVGWATPGAMPAKRHLFSDDIELIGETELGAGTHRYPFEYQLPPELPGDYESMRGEAAIRYQLTAFVDRRFWVDMKAVTPLTVYEPIHEAAHPVRAEGQKTCQFVSHGHIDIQVEVDKNVLEPGETASVAIKLNNQYTHVVRAVRVGIEAVESLLTEEEHEHSDEVHSTEYEIAVEPGAEGSHTVEYVVPEDLYPSIGGSEVLRVSHNLAITIDVPKATDPVVRIPIIVRERPGQPSKAGGI